MIKLKRGDFVPVLVGMGLGAWATLGILLGTPTWVGICVLCLPLLAYAVEACGLHRLYN